MKSETRPQIEQNSVCLYLNKYLGNLETKLYREVYLEFCQKPKTETYMLSRN